MNPCAYGRSAVCWPRTRSMTSATRSGSSRSSILVYRPDELGRAHGRVLPGREVPARAVRDRPDRALDRCALRRTLPALYVARGARLRGCWRFLADGDRFFLPLVLAARRWSTGRWRSPAAGSRAAPSRRCCSREGLLSEGNALMNLGLRRLLGVRRGARRRADRGVRPVGGAAGRRRVVRRDRGRAGRRARPARSPSTRTARRGASASSTGSSSRATTGRCGRCWSASRSRSSASRWSSRSRSSTPRRASARRAPASASCCPSWGAGIVIGSLLFLRAQAAAPGC